MSTLDADTLYGRIAFDEHGQELGEIEAVYLDPRTRAPEWVAVRTGRSETSLAPVSGAEVTSEGVQLAVEEKLVRNAPQSDGLSTELSAEQEAELYHYYAIDYSGRAEQPPL